ncbi:FRG domain-containing protein [Rhodoferax sp. GW822-FHT02A01]|uniref:FRG domain-containing protein n=1 Tax=Rhodoferax sp. GW822-FHT02A01 TaxID=3141537 RepID=UPI00315C5F27
MEEVKSVADFINIILKRPTRLRMLTTYRGHGSPDFRLQPSIFRKQSTRENEHILLRELIAAHPDDFSGDTSTLEALVRMQHYSLPTRLLDVTMNPLVALYFACESVKKRTRILKDGVASTKTVESDGQVVILTVYKRSIRYFDSDTVSCLTNLARLSYNLKEGLDTSLPIEEFNESKSVKRLLHFINQEKHGFLPEIEPSDLDSVILVKPKQSNKRILAQAGAFFTFGLGEEIDDDNNHDVKIERITIASDLKADILSQLDKLGINEKTMFPEIDRAARYITSSLAG